MDRFENKYLDVTDYAVFIGMLLVSTVLGVYFAFLNKKKPNTTSEYLVGNKELYVFPIAMSLSSSYMSPVNFLGMPAEIYMYGSQIVLRSLPSMASVIFIMYLIMPVFYDLNLLSSFEYLTKRFNKNIGVIGSVAFLLNMLVYSSITIYTPALTLAQLSGISSNILIPLLSIICMFYTSVGGLRAVVWADTFQMFLMVLGASTLTILGTYHAGGFKNVWERNENSGRIEFFNMDPDPRTRSTFWTVMLGVFFIAAGQNCISQMVVQRCLSLPSFEKCKRALWLFAITHGILDFINSLNGLVSFATFYKCDPLTTKKISRPDEIIPYTWMFLTQKLPALPGIFITAIFSASFSTVSTNLNSMAGIFVIDIIKPLSKKSISEKTQTFLMKIIVVIFGCLFMILAFILDKVAGITQITMTMMGVTNGPLFGIFLLGMFIPRANAKGAFIGILVSFAFVSWISVGTLIATSQNRIVTPKKPLSIEACDNSTLKEYYSNFNQTKMNQTINQNEIFPLYTISFQYYALIGTITSVVVGTVISYLTGGKSIRRADLKLFSPVVRKFIKTNFEKAEEINLNTVE